MGGRSNVNMAAHSVFRLEYQCFDRDTDVPTVTHQYHTFFPGHIPLVTLETMTKVAA